MADSEQNAAARSNSLSIGGLALLAAASLERSSTDSAASAAAAAGDKKLQINDDRIESWAELS